MNKCTPDFRSCCSSIQPSIIIISQNSTKSIQKQKCIIRVGMDRVMVVVAAHMAAAPAIQADTRATQATARMWTGAAFRHATIAVKSFSILMTLTIISWCAPSARENMERSLVDCRIRKTIRVRILTAWDRTTLNNNSHWTFETH